MWHREAEKTGARLWPLAPRKKETKKQRKRGPVAQVPALATKTGNGSSLRPRERKKERNTDIKQDRKTERKKDRKKERRERASAAGATPSEGPLSCVEDERARMSLSRTMENQCFDAVGAAQLPTVQVATMQFCRE